MYHYREGKDVTEFTDGCDLAQRPGVYLLPMDQMWSKIFILELRRTAPSAVMTVRNTRPERQGQIVAMLRILGYPAPDTDLQQV
jgi:hypothetical protein